MNSYFISLLQVDIERKKNRYSTFKFGNHIYNFDKCYLLLRFNIQPGDRIYVNEFNSYYFDVLPWEMNFKKRNKFHPLFWYGSGQPHFLSTEIMRKMIINKPYSMNDGSFIFKVKIGKAKYRIACCKYPSFHCLKKSLRIMISSSLFLVVYLGSFYDEHPKFIFYHYA
jgi:hypothetical protein